MLAFRLLAALVGLSAGLAAPATSLAHGILRARAEHADARGHNPEGTSPHNPGDSGLTAGAGVAAPDGDDHPHPRIDRAPTVRTDAWVAAAVVATVAALVLPGGTTAPPAVFPDQFPGPDPPTGAPPRLRASPVR